MKTVFLVLASILVSLTMANHMPGHMSPRKHAKHPKVVEGENRLLQGDLGSDSGGDGDMGGHSGDDASGSDGYRALRGLSDELVDANTDLKGDDEVVVAGGTAVRGGAVVARPGPRRWY
ncbi:hypothetical protein V7S43_006198 [Phytophthora oleae]|uniref:RxLR effector protein n=1 Tax=Phytophthora oleae TaxID=2107226 RepID=A0ABD3FRI0_9STRA